MRWRLLSELAYSDRRVGELCALLELPQNLVSYHLGRLRAERVVSRRRSSADGRDSYYVLELARCGELLAETGSGAASGAAPRATTGRARARRARRRTRTRVLFLCTGNSARSQIAEALAERLGGGAVEARSAGSHPKPLHPNAVRVMRERGIDIAGRAPSTWTSSPTSGSTTWSASATASARSAPSSRGHPDLIHWSIPDPARDGDSDRQTYPAFERTAEELATRIAFLLELIEHTQHRPGGELNVLTIS